MAKLLNPKLVGKIGGLVAVLVILAILFMISKLLFMIGLIIAVVVFGISIFHLMSNNTQS